MIRREPPAIRREVQVRKDHKSYWAELVYDPAEPYSVEIVFLHPHGDPVPWEFARDLLAEVYAVGSAGIGDVRMWVIRDRLVLHLSSPEGTSMVSLDDQTVRRFLRATYRVVPRGRERVDVDEALAELFDGAE